MSFYDEKIGSINLRKGVFQTNAGSSLLILFQVDGFSRYTLESINKKRNLGESHFVVLGPTEKCKVESINGVCIEVKISPYLMRLMDWKQEFVVNKDFEMQSIEYDQILNCLNKLAIELATSTQKVSILKNLIEILNFLKSSNVNENLHQKFSVQNIKQYIKYNFQNTSLSLQNVAEYFGITPQYLSFYFNKNVGTSFLNYVNNLRVKQSIDELVIGDKQIVDIAFENGFGSIATFNRVFKKYQNLSPKQYRQKNKINIPISQKQQINLKDIRQKIENNLQRKVIVSRINQTNLSSLRVNTIHIKLPLKSDDISNIELAGFNRIIIDLDLNVDMSNNYLQNLLRNLDALLQKSYLIIWKVSNLVKEEQVNDLVVLFRYFANVISLDNVNCWKLAIDSTVWIRFHLYIEKRMRCFQFRTNFLILGTVKELLSLLENNVENNLRCDFGISEINIEQKISDIEKLSSLVGRNCLYLIWNTKEQRDFLNDTSVVASHFVEKVIKYYQYIGNIAIDSFIDSDLDSFLSGDSGIINNMGVKKNIFYAIHFINQQPSKILKIGDNFLVSFNGKDDISILIFNSVHITQDELENTPELNYQKLRSGVEKRFVFDISNMNNGRYKIKKRNIGLDTDIVGVWSNLDFSSDLSFGEVKYIMNNTYPKMTIKHIKVSNRKMNLEITLKPCDVTYVHIISLY